MTDERGEDGRELIDFCLADQFGREHRRAEYAGSVVVVVGTDRGGSVHVASWLDAVREELTSAAESGRLQALGVADVRGIPSLFRPMVRAAIGKAVPRPVLLDWEGEFAAAYAFAAGACNVMVADERGRIVYQTSGAEATAAAVAPLVRRVRALLGESAEQA